MANKGPTEFMVPVTSYTDFEARAALALARTKAAQKKAAARRPKPALRESAKVTPKRPSRPRPKTEQQQAVEALPAPLRAVAREILADSGARAGVEHMMGRAPELASPATALLAGIAMEPAARAHFDRHLDGLWAKQAVPRRHGEVIVGGGLHAAIYAAVRVAKGHPAPLVLERRDRVGGAFAVSAAPAFFLNSRNRPGPLSVPGAQGALNVLPGSMIQPSDLGGSEYQTNDVLGWVIRCSLAMNAKVAAGADVTRVAVANPYGYSSQLITVEGGRGAIKADRVIVATGLNNPRDTVGIASGRVLNFESFMRRMDGPFPLRGLGRVAVVGAGDSAKTVIEALTGQGPAGRFSVAALDWPETIDWFGCTSTYKAEWEECNRSRYLGIGRLLPRKKGEASRVRALPRAAVYAEGFESILIDDVPYDYVVDCTGFIAGPTVACEGLGSIPEAVGRRDVATKAYSGGYTDPEVHTIGPAAGLALTAGEEKLLRGIAENSTSLFRYASRTAALAAHLPATGGTT